MRLLTNPPARRDRWVEVRLGRGLGTPKPPRPRSVSTYTRAKPSCGSFSTRTSRSRGQPAIRQAEICGDGYVPGALGEIPEPVVVALLTAPGGRHGDDHRPFAH